MVLVRVSTDVSVSFLPAIVVVSVVGRSETSTDVSVRVVVVGTEL